MLEIDIYYAIISHDIIDIATSHSLFKSKSPSSAANMYAAFIKSTTCKEGEF